MVWDQLSDNLQWKSGNTYIPKGGQHLICFVDDLHEAKVSNMYHDVLMNGLSDETTERSINCNKYTVVFLLKHYLYGLSITNTYI